MTYEIAPTLTWNFFQGTQKIQATRLAKAQLDESIRQFNQTVLTSVQEVDNAMSSYKNSIITRLVILVPLVLLVIRRTPADMGTKAYGADEEGETGKARKTEREWNVSLKEVKKKPMFWCFVLGCTLISATAAVITQIPASVMDAGYTFG